MEIKIVENAKEILCDVLIINKFEGKETSNALVNRFAPKSFEGKPGQIFCNSYSKRISGNGNFSDRFR